MRIRVWNFKSIRTQIQGFSDQKLLQRKIYLFLSQYAIFFYPWASMMNMQATGEAFSPQNRISKHEISSLFLWDIFALLKPDPT